MKKNIPIALALILGLALAGCGAQDRGEATPTPSPTPQDSPTPTASSSPSPDVQHSPAPTGQEITLAQQYTNSRFGFSVRYPDSWEAVESQNGDGVTFDTSDSSQEIRAYGTNYMSEVSEPYSRAKQEGFTLTEIELDSGIRVSIIQGQEDYRYIYEMVTVHGQTEYHIVFDLTQDYYDANQPLIEAVTDSFTHTES